MFPLIVNILTVIRIFIEVGIVIFRVIVPYRIVKNNFLLFLLLNLFLYLANSMVHY